MIARLYSSPDQSESEPRRDWLLRNKHDSRLLRYGAGVLLGLVAALLTSNRGAMLETPFFLFLAAVGLSALYGGLGPAFITTAVSLLLMRGMFPPHVTTYLGETPERIERMVGFVLVTLMLSCLIAALRRERNLLRSSADVYEELADRNRDAVLLVDISGAIVWANRSAQRMFGRGIGERNAELCAFLPNECWESHLAALKRNMDGPQEGRVKRLTLGSQHRCLPVEVSAEALDQGGKRVLALTLRDVSRNGVA